MEKGMLFPRMMEEKFLFIVNNRKMDKEKLFLIYTKYGYIGTVTWIETDDHIYSFADLYGFHSDTENVFLDTEIHYKLRFAKPTKEEDVIENILRRTIDNYDQNQLAYHWKDIKTSDYNTHPKN